MFNTLKDEHNTTVGNIGSTLENDLKGAGTELEAYGKKIQAQQNEGQQEMKDITTKLPTSLLSKSIKEITKTYDSVINAKILAKMKENVSSAARRYKQD
jgi:phosphoglycerate dehydrogenase-like enzyme